MTNVQQLKIEDLKIGANDLTGEKVELIYARVRPLYAVYRTARRVAVMWADDDEEAVKQRTRLASLNVPRSEINGLINGWRYSKQPRFSDRARRYDSRVAAALVMAFDGDPAAGAILAQIKADLVDERTSAGRFDQLISGFLLVSAFVLALSVLLWATNHAFFLAELANKNFALVSIAGALGAFFSLAIGIRGRTVLPNLIKRDNILDAVLRAIIGIIAAEVLYILLRSDLVTLFIGNAKLSGDGLTVVKAAVVGFLAGFLERLVPDLLAKASASGPTAAPPATDANSGLSANQPGGTRSGNGPSAPAGGGDIPPPPPHSDEMPSTPLDPAMRPDPPDARATAVEGTVAAS